MGQDDDEFGMNNLGDKTAQKTNATLASEEARVLRMTPTNLESLKPKISDKAAFEQLMEAVKTSTESNEDVAALRRRIQALGEGVIKVAKQAYSLLQK